MEMEDDVISYTNLLIIEAGLAGRLVAAWASRYNMSARILDRKSARANKGHADGLQCRTMKTLDIDKRRRRTVWPVSGKVRRLGCPLMKSMFLNSLRRASGWTEDSRSERTIYSCPRILDRVSLSHSPALFSSISSGEADGGAAFILGTPSCCSPPRSSSTSRLSSSTVFSYSSVSRADMSLSSSQ